MTNPENLTGKTESLLPNPPDAVGELCPIPAAESALDKAGRQIARGATVIMLAYIISNLVGLIRGMVVSNAFGTSASLDSFNAANRVTELLFNLTAGGRLALLLFPCSPDT